MRDELQKENVELTKFLMDKETNSLLIDAKLQRIASLQIQIQKETIKHLSQIEEEVLTPQQRQEFFIIIRRALSPNLKIEPEKGGGIRRNFFPWFFKKLYG